MSQAIALVTLIILFTVALGWLTLVVTTRGGKDGGDDAFEIRLKRTRNQPPDEEER